MNTNETTTPYNGGPRTPQGKQASSQNATKHSLCSNSLRVLPNENVEDLKALEATWFNCYQPRDEAETRLVKLLVEADWHLERANRTVAEVEAQIYECGYLPLNWSDEQHQKLARFTRYQTARANAVAKARKAIEDYRRNRLNEVTKTEKHAIYKEKSKPKRTPMEAIEDALRKKREQQERTEKLMNQPPMKLPDDLDSLLNPEK